jgi:hypothetical protein
MKKNKTAQAWTGRGKIPECSDWMEIPKPDCPKSPYGNHEWEPYETLILKGNKYVSTTVRVEKVYCRFCLKVREV